jgi:3-phenylpropionate/trans-cinnamate dioxygenase ferredoxin reductase component
VSASRIVVIGGGVASAAAVAGLRAEGFDGAITLVSAEDTVPYERPPLSKEFLMGRSGSVPVKDPAWYEQHSVELVLGRRATRLDLAARTVAVAGGPGQLNTVAGGPGQLNTVAGGPGQLNTVSGGSVIGYDQLLLATGVRPRVLPGLDGDGVCYLRTVRDATELRDRITAGGHVAVLGGGFIGCEVASAAIQLGKRATILEALPTLLYRALGPDLGQVVAGIHRDAGVDVRTGQAVTGLVPRSGGGVTIATGDGPVDADVLVVGVGTVPNTELAAQAGLPVEGGVLVDEHFATAAPGVWAVGDVAAQYLPGYRRRVRVEHHDTALRHGRAVARNMLGRPEPFSDVHWFWSDQFEHTISSAGLRPEADPGGPLIIRGSLEQRSFSAFSLDGGRLRAVISLNRPKDVLDVRKLIARDHSATPDQLRDESLPLRRLAATPPIPA